jgi:hypothetical protein
LAPRPQKRGVTFLRGFWEQNCAKTLEDPMELSHRRVAPRSNGVLRGGFTLCPHFQLVQVAFAAYRARITRNSNWRTA